MSSMPVMRTIERMMFGAGIVCLAWSAVVRSDAFSHQANARTGFQSPPFRGSASHHDDSLIGVLTLPRLRLSVAVLYGDDAASLRRGAGHLPETPLPWEKGNSAVAGHRDTFFRPLKDVEIGDAISLATPQGTFGYRVRRISIVAPDNLSVLHDDIGADLTLITCYPFGFIGAAPKRFVIHAERFSGGVD